jgi:hypothetical protein
MPKILAFVLALVLLATGLVFATSVAIAGVALLGAWKLRNSWRRLVGSRAAVSGDPEADGPMGAPSRVPGVYLSHLRKAGAASVTDVRAKD